MMACVGLPVRTVLYFQFALPFAGGRAFLPSQSAQVAAAVGQ